MFENFGKDICNIFKDAEEEMLRLRHPYVGSEHLLLSLMKNDEVCRSKLEENNVNYESFRDELIEVIGKSNKESEYILYTPLLRRIIDQALEIANNRDGVVKAVDLFASLLNESDGIAIRILKNMNVNINKLRKEISSGKKSMDSLTEYGVLLGGDDDVLIGREKEVEELINILMKKNKANGILVGMAGVGKTAIVNELARRIRKGEVPSKLNDYQVYEIPLGSLISGTKYRGDFEERLNNILKEAMDNKIILFIDEIHGIVTCGSAEGAVSAGEILKPYLAKGKIRIIGATTQREYNKYIMKDKALMRRFEIVNVKEPNDNDTLEILKGIKKDYEDFHNVIISDEVLGNIISLSSRYMKNKSNPDRAIELLDIVCAGVNKDEKIRELRDRLNQDKMNSLKGKDYERARKITKRLNTLNKLKRRIDNEDVIEQLRYYLNIASLDDKKEIMSNLEINLDKLIGQEKAKEKVKKIINYKIEKNDGVMSLLLLGNTGVGKTELVKLVARSVDEKAFIRLDMSEYNLETAVNKLIGVSQGYVGYDDGYEFEKVKTNPVSIILVDELEKAHPKVLNLFLQILDEGFVTDVMGDKIDFSNCIIFFTSNLGRRKNVGFGDSMSNELDDFLSPEFLGRFDEVIRFDDIEKEDVIEYVDKYNVINRKNVSVDEVLKKCDYKKYGLRNVKKIITSLERENYIYM